MGPFAQHLESSPLDESMPNGALDSAIAMLPVLVVEWRDQLEEAILDLLRQSPAYADQHNLTTDVLYHASTVFTCSRCRGVLTYPSVFAHGCFSKMLSTTDEWAISPNARMKKTDTVSLSRSQATWETGRVGALIHAAFSEMTVEFGAGVSIWYPGPLLQFSDPMHLHTVSLLDSLGLDRSTSATSFLATNPYVEGVCQCFRPGVAKRASAPRTAVRWLQAISQCRRHRSGSYADSFAPVDEAHLQGLAIHATAAPTRFAHRCLWCGVTLSSFSMEWHLMIKHGLSRADADRVREIAPFEAKRRDSTMMIGS
ncbi:hypothetical protein FA13DRAFT_365521 [Coprinellus micaceus]|uniref:Uncharacterized protein n=1 Tax=Coprinellus micaceus TaxID=71717 RepID=A0A4Y7TBR9_COPMI|nr:hypothetical protein FA13DRAFT_365521 [Coprinellus micaceus]